MLISVSVTFPFIFYPAIDRFCVDNKTVLLDVGILEFQLFFYFVENLFVLFSLIVHTQGIETTHTGANKPNE